MIRNIFLLAACCVVAGCAGANGDRTVIASGLRPPAYPLVSIDPYTSAWSMTDNLFDGSVKHWTGADFPLIGAIKVDGQVFRFMGTENIPMEVIAPTSEQGGWSGRYVNQKPADGWYQPGFDDSSWRTGEAAFGTVHNEPTARTPWYTDYIWVRRTVEIPEGLDGRRIFLEYSHDDDAIIYVNGMEVVNTGNRAHKNLILELPENVARSLKPGENTIAAYCYNRVGNSLLDFGLVAEKPHDEVFRRTPVQRSVDVQATQTHYVFDCGNVELALTFTAPLLMDNLELVSRPVNYITYKVSSTDGKQHDVELYFEASAQWALDKPLQESVLEGFEKNGLVYLKAGSYDQNILGKQGDDLRIDWGYFYLAAGKDKAVYAIGESDDLRNSFATGKLSQGEVARREKTDEKLALVKDLGKVKAADGHLLIGYDDLYSVQYFGEDLRPYWNRKGDKDIFSQFEAAERDYGKLVERCYEFDRKLMETAAAAGGKHYAELCALAYRQAISAHKLLEAPNGDLLFLSKENNSNGSIGTVDVTYPSAPLFLYYNTDLAKGLLNHIFYYSESGKWTKPFPAHDIGTYPLANGQTYGGDMPIEEAGNMVILSAAITAVDGNGEYARRHWDMLTLWTDYLSEYGLDPENQLCTDDFAGHFAHNVNLSVKAIMGVACYGYMAGVLGMDDTASKYTDRAREMAAEWVQMANDGDHYRLTFDKPGTWSQKYNLVWDKILDLGIFPADVARTEIAYYLTKQNRYGLPLDNRETYTKTDWVIWTATLADELETFEKFIDPIYDFMNETKDRIPMSDWIFTDSPHYRGFKARSVVGGYFIKMLAEDAAFD
ncbi:MAG: DUF4965 domain-containing protein [Alistipes sp.]|nr:DUF4965 domain-containing protein [Alistipes sp.]